MALSDTINAPVTTNLAEWPVNVVLNNASVEGLVIVLQKSSNEFFLPKENLIRWRLELPNIIPLKYEGNDYYPSSAFPNLKIALNADTLQLNINVPADSFIASELDVNSKLLIPEKPAPGSFINYDVSTQIMRGASQPESKSYAGVFEAGFFNYLGVITSSFLGSHDNAVGTIKATSQFTRLQTLFTRDDPAHMRTIHIGDTISDSGMWSSSVLFGGIQYATNFETQPNFITNPLPSVSGAAIVPSSVDLYVNNSRINSQNLPAGPFTINNVPIVNGAGTLSVVTTDLLGHQQITNIPFYTSSNLLKPGLEDFSYEAGFVRNNYSTASDDYGKAILVGTQTKGITNNLTTQWHTELLRDQQTVGLGGYYLLGTQGIFNTAIAGSRSSRGLGELAVVGFQHQDVKGINFSTNMTLANKTFQYLGLQNGQQAPSLQAQTFLGKQLGKAGTVGVSYTRQNNRNNQPNYSLLGVSYNKTLLKQLSLNISATTNIGGQTNKNILILMSQGIGNSGVSTSVNEQIQADSKPEQTLQLSNAPPIGIGYGYDIRTTQGPQENYQANFTAQREHGTYIASVAKQSGGQTGYRFEAQGSILVMDKTIHFSRLMNGSFGLVQVPGYSNVGVYAFNQLAGYTDANGYLLIPSLIPYYQNQLKIEANDLPVDAEIDATELIAIPYFNSGTLVRFPVKPSNGVTFTLLQEDNSPVPNTAEIQIEGQTETFPLSDDGTAYISGLSTSETSLIAKWEDKSCTFKLAYPAKTDQTIPDLGHIICKESTSDANNSNQEKATVTS